MHKVVKNSDTRRDARVLLDLEIEVKSSNELFLAKTINISSSGACILAGRQLASGTRVQVKNVFGRPFRHFSGTAVIQWTHSAGDDFILGMRFDDLDEVTKANISTLFGPGLADQTAKGLLRLIVFGGVPLTSLVSIFLFFTSKRGWGLHGLVFLNLILFERVWETFYTSKEKRIMEASADWSITAVSFYYILMLIGASVEFFSLKRQIATVWTIFGLLLLFLSLCLRWNSMKSLGEHWAVHATGEKKKSFLNLEIVTIGPYKYVRHPIYLAVILELIAIPLTLNAYFALTFVLLVNVPLQILRSRLEERKNIEIFGLNYVRYMNHTPGFIPAVFRFARKS